MPRNMLIHVSRTRPRQINVNYFCGCIFWSYKQEERGEKAAVTVAFSVDGAESSLFREDKLFTTTKIPSWLEPLAPVWV